MSDQCGLGLGGVRGTGWLQPSSMYPLHWGKAPSLWMAMLQLYPADMLPLLCNMPTTVPRHDTVLL